MTPCVWSTGCYRNWTPCSPLNSIPYLHEINLRVSGFGKYSNQRPSNLTSTCIRSWKGSMVRNSLLFVLSRTGLEKLSHQIAAASWPNPPKNGMNNSKRTFNFPTRKSRPSYVLNTNLRLNLSPSRKTYSIELLGAAKVYSREYSEAFFLFTSTLFHLCPFPQPPSGKRQIARSHGYHSTYFVPLIKSSKTNLCNTQSRELFQSRIPRKSI